MVHKYLYIDDNKIEQAAGVIAGLSIKNVLSIEFDNPKGEWEQERERIESKDFIEYDGLILDLNLEENRNPNNDKFSFYKGSTLAQEIRNISKSGIIKEIPIILLSATKNLKLYFDKTNEDLFDLIIEKEKLNSDLYIDIKQKLISLSSGYKILNEKNKTINDVFNHELNIEDIKFKSEIDNIFSYYPTHSISNFIIKNILEIDGVIIKESTLAARLGVDIEESNPSWQELLSIINNSEYDGVFSVGWKRWWMSKIDKWWEDNFEKTISLRSLNASDRVTKINDKFGLNLIHKEKLEKSKSDKFWTTCIGIGSPIDTIDGLLIAGQDNLYSWQDRSYVSIKEALKPDNKEKWGNISSTELFKLEHLKKIFPNERPKR